MARHDEIRVGDAERDAVMVALHDHFAAGRLDRGEMDERLDTALTAKTRGDLRTLVKDLPAPTGLPEPEKAPGHGAPLAFPGPFFGGPGTLAGPAVFGGPGHPAWQRHHRHLAARHRHGPHFPAFPLLLAVFLVLAFTAGPGTGILVVLQIALAIWVIRAALLAFGVRRHHHRSPRA
ncbi:DUF1707 domain-containing protein [Actinomadura sp. NAK00032]|uniref:DUF1707 SHOCT-like domain-containing protein n=1 Tax=Actinomadura sp. NAK00032 TaxID=2742128 RepID=UPI00158FBDCE|nr:DUF1707 domain-containing protein [Actinomadura sp. NAK00032]QKW37639.1 DUF1707 domain-containing protein [Actinomadura sp. NAK00032]